MSWEEEFKRRVVTFLVRKGSLVSAHASGYGWMEEDTGEKEHVLECGIDLQASTWKDSTWSEFLGTFAEPGSRDCRGLDAVVTCKCTLVEGITWRYDGTHGDMLRVITEPPQEEEQ